MKIEHLGIWVADLQLMKNFYERYFQAKAGPLYHNPVKNFSSYFLSFPEGDTRIELMYQPQVAISAQEKGHTQGLAHLAISLGSREEVRQQTELLRNEGYLIAGEPRQTGDGYYESVILDPEKNVIEICSD